MDKNTGEKFTFFYGGVFSQWYYSEFKAIPMKFHPKDEKNDEEMTFSNAEQWMMFHKAKLFKDENMANKIAAESDPSIVKKMGRKIANFNEETWNNHKEYIVYMGNKLKFEQNPQLLSTLLNTKGTTIVEASGYDKIWGIGLWESDKKASIRAEWKGENLLGKILTNLREDFNNKK